MKNLYIIVFILFTTLTFAQSNSNNNRRYLEGQNLENFKDKIIGLNNISDKVTILEATYLEGEVLEKFKAKVLGKSKKILPKAELESKFLKGRELEKFRKKISTKNFNFQKLDKKEH